MKLLTKEEMEALSTRRLLAYHKKLYKFLSKPDGYDDSCSCPHCKTYNKYMELIDLTKSVLDTREHIERG